MPLYSRQLQACHLHIHHNDTLSVDGQVYATDEIPMVLYKVTSVDCVCYCSVLLGLQSVKRPVHAHWLQVTDGRMCLSDLHAAQTQTQIEDCLG